MGDRLRTVGFEMVNWALDVISELTFGVFKSVSTHIGAIKGGYFVAIYTIAFVFLIISIFTDGFERLGGRKDISNAFYKYIIDGPMIIFHMASIPTIWGLVVLFGNYINDTIKTKIGLEAFVTQFGDKVTTSIPDTFFLGGFFILCAGVVLFLLGIMSFLVFYELLFLFFIGPIVMVKSYNDHSRIMHYYAEILFRLVHPGIYLLGFKVVFMSMSLVGSIVAPLSILAGLIAVLLLPSFIRPFLISSVGGGGNELATMGRLASLAKLAA